MINNINTNQEVFYHQQNNYNNYQHQGVVDSGGSFAVSDYEREREIEKQRKRDRLSKLKCSRGESWVWNPRQFYCQIMCPVCERGSRELTVLHFRNHLELQHTAEEVENVKVCKLCHRAAVQNRSDVFDGLILDLDPQSKANHMEQKHANYPHECEFMGIYEKHKRTMGDNWGLEGIERDSQKIYKYAKENFSRAKKNERNAAAGDGSELSSIGGSCASITPEPPITYNQSSTFTPQKNGDLTNGKENYENASMPNGYYDPSQAWNTNSGFSYRSLLQDLNDDEEFTTTEMYPNQSASTSSSSFNASNNTVQPKSSQSVSSSQSSDEPNTSTKSTVQKRSAQSTISTQESQAEAKNRRLDRCADPELRKLRCGIGGSYRFSMSKLHFSKVSCPYCLLPSDGEVTGKVFIKAEYWRRHVTEVHNKVEEIEETKKLVLCLECYNSTLSKRVKSSDGSSVLLPEFDGLFRNKMEQKRHVQEVHNGNEIEFISVWDKKEAAGSSRTPRSSSAASTTPPASNAATPPPSKSEAEKVQPIPQAHPAASQSRDQFVSCQPSGPNSYISTNHHSYNPIGYNSVVNPSYQSYHPYTSYNHASYQSPQPPTTLPRDVNQVQTLTCQIANPTSSSSHHDPMSNSVLYDNFHYNQPHYQIPQHDDTPKYNIVFANDF